MNTNALVKSLPVVIALIVLSACSGTPAAQGNGNGSTFTIGGTVSGLSGSGLVLQDNGGDNLTITKNGAFTFATAMAKGGAYAVAVMTQPTGPAQTCSVASGSGAANANVTSVQVTCATGSTGGSGFTIGGTVTGLSGSGLVLQNNGGNNLTISTNGTFSFSSTVASGTAYDVTVLTQPTTPTQSCSVANGAGTANANVGNIVVTCSAGTIPVGGTVSGLAGTELVLQDNSGDNLTIKGNGSFTFATLLTSGATYNVSIATQPGNPSQTCTVANASGTATAAVTSVQVVCPAVYYSVGGQMVGLHIPTGQTLDAILQNNGGDNLPLTGNGAFTFPTEMAYGSQYDIFLLVSPNTQSQPCVIWGYQGTVLAQVTSIVVDCGHNDWNWMDGADTSNALGTATAAPTTNPITSVDTATPGGRKYAATWVDNSGNLWLFGGIGWDTTTTSESIFLNDMWEFTGTNQYYGGYNTYWQQAQTNNWGSITAPLPRWGAVTWTDASGKLWMFGGQWGELGAGGIGFMNDVWTFNTSTKTWTSVPYGNATCNASGGVNTNGVYGTPNQYSANNCPGSRWGATARLDSNHNLWLFGGFGYDASSSIPGLLNDLWEFNGSQWRWVSGSNMINQDGVYGSGGSSVPGGRQASVSWMDSNNNFWVFGGYNLSAQGEPNAFNDLWEYNSTSQTWTFVSGSSSVNQTGVYGIEGTAASGNIPGARWGSSAWIDPSNNLWLFGGEGFDATADGTLGDLWEFNPSTTQWTWVKGPDSVTQTGVWGPTPSETDLPHVTNFPSTRMFPAYWTDTTNGYFWMFGGEGVDSTGTTGYGQLNDLWRYLPFP